MTDRERLNKLAKCFRDYMSKEGCEPINGYSNQFYDGVLWAFARLTEVYPPYEEESEAEKEVKAIEEEHCCVSCKFGNLYSDSEPCCNCTDDNDMFEPNESEDQ